VSAPSGARAAERPLRECVVVVTPRSFGSSDPSLRDDLERQVGEVRYHPGPLGAAELSVLVRDADGLLAGLDEVSAEVLSAAGRLRVVARYGVGTDRVDLEAARRCGITVTVTPGANANAVAELTIALAFVLARPIFEGHARVLGGEWPSLRGFELSGKWLGLVGLGRVGSLVAAKANALGIKTLAYDPNITQARLAGLVSFEELAARSDLVSLHAPLTEATRGMVGRKVFERMKEGSVLINTARGALVDEEALLWALDDGPLRAAALDVLTDEPPASGNPLLGRADVIVLPHIAPHTDEATAAMGRAALEDLLAVLSGRSPRHAVAAPVEAA